MGFTPFQAFIKGGADYNNKVNLMRLQGEQDLRKVRATATAKALADSAGSTKSFTAGDVSLVFNVSDGLDIMFPPLFEVNLKALLVPSGDTNPLVTVVFDLVQ